MITVKAHIHRPRTLRKDPQTVSMIKDKGRTEYAAILMLARPKFIVSAAGRNRAVEQGRRNVHAWVKGGYLYASDRFLGSHEDFTEWRQASYNPFRAGHFFDVETGEPVQNAEYAILYGGKCYYV